MDFKKAILICDSDYNPILFDVKAKHPEWNIKFLSRNELIDMAGRKIKRGFDPVASLLTHHIDYSRAKKWVNLLRVADLEKAKNKKEFTRLLEVNSFIEDHFEEDELGFYQLSTSSLYLFEMDEDKEIQSLLSRRGLSFSLLHFSDFGIKPINHFETAEELMDKPFSYFLFKNKYQQFNHIYSSIRSLLLNKSLSNNKEFVQELLKDPHKERRIKVLIESDVDLFYASSAASLFKVPTCGLVATSFLSRPTVMAKVKEIHEKESFDFTENELLDESLLLLKKDIIDRYGLASLSFDEGYASLIEIAKSKLDKTPLSEEGISLVADFTFDPEALIFVTNFQYGSFYRVYDDKNVLTDDELVELDCNPSYVLTSLDERKKKNYLKYQRIALLSRVAEHLSDAIYDSSILEQWKAMIKEENASIELLPLSDEEKAKRIQDNQARFKAMFEKPSLVNPEGTYVDALLPLLTADIYDEHFYYGKTESIRNYDHSFKGFNKQKPEWHAFLKNRLSKNGARKPSWSITNIESYPSCPFAYLMKMVIPSKMEDHTYPSLGVMVHKMMEHAFSNGKSLADENYFESLFAEGRQAFYDKIAKNNEVVDKEKELLLDLYHFWLKRIFLALSKWQDDLTVEAEYPEQFIRFTLSDGLKDYDFTG